MSVVAKPLIDLNRVWYEWICSAQSKNRYNSGIVLRKVGILTMSANSGIVPDNSRIAQGIHVENR